MIETEANQFYMRQEVSGTQIKINQQQKKQLASYQR